MDVLLISDTHGPLDERLLAAAGHADLVVHGGDIGGPDVVQALRLVHPDVVFVRGNNDLAGKWPAASIEDLDHIPWSISRTLPGGVLTIDHGHRHGAPAVRHRRLRGAYPQSRAVVYGHSHHLCIDDAQSPWVLNPGASGRVRTFGGPSALWLTATPSDWTVDWVQLEPA